MKILMTSDAVGGVWTYSLELARGLSARGHDVALANLGPAPSEDQRRQALAIRGLSLHEGPFKLEWMQEPWGDVADAGQWLLELERSLDPDLVHLNGYCHGALDWRAPTVVVAHSSVDGWWEAVRGEPVPDPWSRYRREVRQGIQAADMVIAPTQAMLDEVQTHYGPLPRASRVVHNGRREAEFRPGAKETFTLAVGRLWDEAKDMASLDAAAQGSPWPVRVVGETRHPDTGEEARFRHAHPLGRLPHDALLDHYARASLYALPARYEPFGLSALEAALSGCALVLSDIPSLRELWRGTSFFVSPGDVSSLRSVLNLLARDASLRHRLACEARERALLYSAERMSDGYALAYATLTGLPSVNPQETPTCAS